MDGMTIDEVIKYFDDDAKENEKLAIIYRGNDDDMAEMHKQDAIRSSYVAEWLRELKDYRERMPSYEAGYNDAKREIALSGEYERAYQRGHEDGYCEALEDTH